MLIFKLISYYLVHDRQKFRGGDINFLTLLFYFRLNANPAIADMKGYLPLHRAVLGNHEEVLDVFKENFPTAYVVIFCFTTAADDKFCDIFPNWNDIT